MQLQKDNQKPDQETLNRIRSHHFNFGNKVPDYTSQTKAHFDFKGNPKDIMSTLEESRKKDLRASHFEMGSHKNDFISEKLQSDQSALASGRDGRSEIIRNSGSRVFQGNTSVQGGQGEYKTINQTF